MIAFIEQLILEAGELIQTLIQEELHIKSKDTHDWVTNIDYQVEAFLVNGIVKAYPDANFLTEEDTIQTQDLNNLFIIDPIDGTTNLIHQKQHFAISLAYYNNNEPLFGFVYDVMAQRLFKGIKGEGAYLNNTPYQINPNRDALRIEQGLIFGDLSKEGLFKKPLPEIKNKIATHRFLGSAAIEVCEVAFEMGHAYVFPKITLWDVAAAFIILKEAGGSWYFGDTIEGYPLDKNHYYVIAATNKNVLENILSWK